NLTQFRSAGSVQAPDELRLREGQSATGHQLLAARAAARQADRDLIAGRGRMGRGGGGRALQALAELRDRGPGRIHARLELRQPLQHELALGEHLGRLPPRGAPPGREADRGNHEREDEKYRASRDEQEFGGGQVHAQWAPVIQVTSRAAVSEIRRRTVRVRSYRAGTVPTEFAAPGAVVTGIVPAGAVLTGVAATGAAPLAGAESLLGKPAGSDALPPSVESMTTVTRRLALRPSAVALLATGCCSPNPTTASRSLPTPRSERTCTTLPARAADSSQLE